MLLRLYLEIFSSLCNILSTKMILLEVYGGKQLILQSSYLRNL